MNRQQATSIAYFDGYTIDQIREMGLSHGDLCEIAALCFEWANRYPHASDVYFKRCKDILMLSPERHKQQLEKIQELTDSDSTLWMRQVV